MTIFCALFELFYQIVSDPKNLNNEDFEEALMISIMKETTTVQKAIYRNQLQDGDDCLDYMMKQPNIMPRYRKISSNQITGMFCV